MRCVTSTSLPSTLPPSAALASSAPIAAATPPAETGAANCRTEPSGSVMFTMETSSSPRPLTLQQRAGPNHQKTKSADGPRFLRESWTRTRLPITLGEQRSWRSHNHRGPFSLVPDGILPHASNGGSAATACVAENARQRPGVERLHQVVVESRLERLAPVLLGAIAGERDEVGLVHSQVVTHALAGLEPGDARQPDVHEHELRSEEHTSELQSPCNIVCR